MRGGVEALFASQRFPGAFIIQVESDAPDAGVTREFQVRIPLPRRPL